MAQLDWSSDEDAWAVDLVTEQFDELRVLVRTDGESDRPTEIQLAAVAVVEKIANEGLPPLTELARKYALQYLGPDEVDDMEDEDLMIDIHAVFIPGLRASADTYMIFVGNSDIDIEHGVAVVCKNGSLFAVTHSDIAYSSFSWDDTVELDSILGN